MLKIALEKRKKLKEQLSDLLLEFSKKKKCENNSRGKGNNKVFRYSNVSGGQNIKKNCVNSNYNTAITFSNDRKPAKNGKTALAPRYCGQDSSKTALAPRQDGQDSARKTLSMARLLQIPHGVHFGSQRERIADSEVSFFKVFRGTCMGSSSNFSSKLGKDNIRSIGSHNCKRSIQTKMYLKTS